MLLAWHGNEERVTIVKRAFNPRSRSVDVEPKLAAIAPTTPIAYRSASFAPERSPLHFYEFLTLGAPLLITCLSHVVAGSRRKRKE